MTSLEDPTDSEPPDDSAMKQYQMMVDIYKFHFEIVLKFIIFYYAITGAVLSYIFSQPNSGFMRFGLVLPIFMGIALGLFALFGAVEVDPLKKDITRVTEQLHLKPFPSERLLDRLALMLSVTSVLCFLTAVAGIIVFVGLSIHSFR